MRHFDCIKIPESFLDDTCYVWYENQNGCWTRLEEYAISEVDRRYKELGEIFAQNIVSNVRSPGVFYR